MTDDGWMRELAQANREKAAEDRSRLDERWDRLSAGELAPEDEAELRALAEASEEAREAYEAFRPLGPDFEASMASAVAEELAKQAPVEPQKRQARVLPFRPAISRFGGWVTAGAAAAAAAALFLVLRNPASLLPLPAYVADLSGGAQSYRGTTEPSSGPPVFVPGSLLTLAAGPQHPVTGPVEADFFLERGAELAPWRPRPPFEARNGAVRLRGILGKDFRLEPGNWRIWVVVGRPGKIPSVNELQAELRAGRAGQADWQAVYSDLRVEDRASP